MSDPDVPQPEKQDDDAVGAAAAASDAAEAAPAEQPAAAAVDPDLAAFEAAERDFPGTFATPELEALHAQNEAAEREGAEDAENTDRAESADRATPNTIPAATDEPDEVIVEFGGKAGEAAAATASAAAIDETIAEARAAAGVEATEATKVLDEPAASVPADAAATTVLDGAGVAAATPARETVDSILAPNAPQPIFVQAPEPPRDRGNRGAIAGIGLLATIVFAVLFFGIALGIGLLSGSVDTEEIVDTIVATVSSVAFWVPVVMFYLGFCILGAVINRGRWGFWVIFGIIVGLFAYAGQLFGDVVAAPFWTLSARSTVELIETQAFSPLAIAAFVLGRELTIWFGAWAARSGARKTALNAEAQREYERTIEAGPTLPE